MRQNSHYKHNDLAIAKAKRKRKIIQATNTTKTKASRTVSKQTGKWAEYDGKFYPHQLSKKDECSHKNIGK